MIWSLWAVLLPIGIVAGYLSRPKKVTQELLQAQQITGHINVINSIERENYKISIVENSTPDKHDMLLIEFVDRGKTPMPSMLLYRVIDSTTNNIDKQELVGRVQGKGAHYFPFIGKEGAEIGKSYYKYLLYDIIKKQVVDIINFKR